MTTALIILVVLLSVSRIKVKQPVRATIYPKTPSQQYAEQIAIARSTGSCYDWSDVKQNRGC